MNKKFVYQVGNNKKVILWCTANQISMRVTVCLLKTSSSVGATARCGLWPVEQYLSICPYLSPTLSIFWLPTLEDLFPLLLSILSWVFLFVSSLPVLEWRFLGILSSSILSRWPSQLILCPFIYFTIFSSLLISSSSRFVLLFQLKICIAFKINWIENMKGIFF